MTVPKVIDVSRYQAGLKFDEWAKAGGLAIIAKASEAAGIKDGSFEGFRAQAKALGLGFASYHFLRPGSSAADQAAWYLACAEPRLGERIIADWEVGAISPPYLVSFFQAIRYSRPDLQLTVYTGSIGKQQLSSANAWLSANTSLWVAQYAAAPSWPTSTWPDWSLWQFTDEAEIPGWNSHVDASKFNGTDEELKAWFGAPAPIQAVAAAPSIASGAAKQLTKISVTVDAPYEVWVNGVRCGWIDLPGEPS